MRLMHKLNAELGAEWVLIGGLMVQLHVTRYGDGTVRPTDDVDVLADSRKRPTATERVAELLDALEFKLASPTGTELDTAYRFVRGSEVVDVLGPDGTKRPPRTLGRFETIQVRGGTQALKRSETVVVALGDDEVDVRCPDLLGAILLKARVIMSPERDQDREDLIRLLLCVEDPRAMAGQTTKTECTWLRRAGGRLALTDQDLRATFSGEQLATARVTYELLLQND
jgi:hypothetical protein